MVFILILYRHSKYDCVSIDHSLQQYAQHQDLPPPQSSKPIKYLEQNVQHELTTHSTQPDLEPPFLSHCPQPSHKASPHPIPSPLNKIRTSPHRNALFPNIDTLTPISPIYTPPLISHNPPLASTPAASDMWRRVWWQASIRKAAPAFDRPKVTSRVGGQGVRMIIGIVQDGRVLGLWTRILVSW